MTNYSNALGTSEGEIGTENDKLQQRPLLCDWGMIHIRVRATVQFEEVYGTGACSVILPVLLGAHAARI